MKGVIKRIGSLRLKMKNRSSELPKNIVELLDNESDKLSFDVFKFN